MKQNTLGALIQKTRENRKISKVALCHGLCTITALTRYELDIRIPDKFLTDALLQRLGINPFQFEFISSDQEFMYSMKRTELEKLLYHNEIEKALIILNEYGEEIKDNDFLHNQYILLIKAIIHGKQAEYNKAIFLLQQALEYTKCNYDHFGKTDNMLLTDIEIRIIYMLAKYLYCEGKTTESYSKFNALKQYINKMNWDKEKYKEYYPHILYRLSQQEIDLYNWGTAYNYLNEAEKILIQNYKLDNLYEILELKDYVLTQMSIDERSCDNADFILALKIISTSINGKITKEGIALWENTANHPL